MRPVKFKLEIITEKQLSVQEIIHRLSQMFAVCIQSGGGGGGGGETSVMDQLAAERQWLEQQIEQQTDQGERSNTHKEDNSALQV